MLEIFRAKCRGELPMGGYVYVGVGSDPSGNYVSKKGVRCSNPNLMTNGDKGGEGSRPKQ